MENTFNKFEILLNQLESNLNTNIDENENFFEKKLLELVDYRERKKRGQFPTPVNVASFMAKWLSEHSAIKNILDPAIGCGILVQEIIKNISKKGKSDGVTITAYDIDPLMVKASKIRLKNKNIPIAIFNNNFLFEKIDPKYDLIIANPPYIKSNQIDKKDTYFKMIQAQYGIELDGTTGFDCLFLIKCIFLLNEKGKLAFITPSEFLNSSYGQTVKTILLRELQIDALIYFETKEFVFEEGMSSALITLASKVKKSSNHEIQLIRLHNWPGDDILFNSIKNSIIEPPNDIIMKKEVEFNPKEKWIPKFKQTSAYEDLMKKFIPLSELFSVKRGIATGANSYFTLSKVNIEQWKIPDKYLVPILTKANYATPPIFTLNDFNTLVKENKRTFLLNILEDDPKEITEYLKFGVSNKVHEKYLTSNRKKWFFVEKRKPAPILVKVFNRGASQFILNITQALNLTCFHGIYSKNESSKYEKALIIFLSSKLGRESIDLQLRHYGGGLKKMEPKDVENILIPDFQLLNEQEIKKLDDFFDKWAANKNSPPSDESFSIFESIITIIDLKLSSKKNISEK